MKKLFWFSVLSIATMGCNPQILKDVESAAEDSAKTTLKQVEMDVVQGAAGLASKENTIIQNVSQPKPIQPVKPAAK